MQDFQSVYSENAPQVLALGRRFLRQPQDAEDAMQDIFLELWQLWHRFDPRRGDEGGWVKTVARARLIDRTRRQARYRTAMDLLERETAGERSCADERGDDSARARVASALTCLPARQQGLLRLAYVEGFTHSEIARATGTPLGTVKTRLRMGLERLCRDLKRGSATLGSAEER